MGSIGKLYIKIFLSRFYTRICNKNPGIILPWIIRNSLILKIMKNFTKCIIFTNFKPFTLSIWGNHGSYHTAKFSSHRPAHESPGKTMRKLSPAFFKIVQFRLSSLNTYMAVILKTAQAKHSRFILDVYRRTHLSNQI